MAKDESTAPEFDPVEYKVSPTHSLVGNVRADDTAEQVEEKVQANIEAVLQAQAEAPPAEEPPAGG